MSTAVRILATGGTIASTAEEGAARPTISGERLAAVLEDSSAAHDGPSPDLEVTVESVASLLSFQLGFAEMATLVERARAADGAGVDAVVVTHGTDAMAETAAYLDLALDTDAPVVLTGAQRRPDQPGADGPANLLDAVRAATDDRLAGAGGVYVAFNESLFAARDVRKLHSHRPDGFGAPSTGPVASMGPDGVRLHRPPGSRFPTVDAHRTEARVPIVASAAGVAAESVAATLSDDPDGVVVLASGLGNVAPGVAAGLEPVLESPRPVVVTTRCPAGPVVPVYGTDGGGQSLAADGALFGGTLSAPQARVATALGLAAGADLETVLERSRVRTDRGEGAHPA